MKDRLFGILGLFVVLLGLVLPARSAEPHWPDALIIGTASPGGTYYAYGEGLRWLRLSEQIFWLVSGAPAGFRLPRSAEAG